MKSRIYQEGIFKSKWLSKFISCLFFFGNKWKTEKLVYLSFFYLKKNYDSNGLFLFFESLEYLKPWVGLKLTTSKAKTKKIKAYPIVLNKSIQFKKSIFWLIKSIQLRKEIFIYKKINNEIKEIIFNEATNSINKKKEYYDFAIMAKSVEKFKWN